MKKCPFCAEDIQDAAIVCKHCHRDLTGLAAAASVNPVGPPPTTPSLSKMIAGSLVVIGLFLVFMGGSEYYGGATTANTFRGTVLEGDRDTSRMLSNTMSAGMTKIGFGIVALLVGGLIAAKIPKPIKIAATVAVFVGAFGGLLYSRLPDGTEYYKQVDEVMSEPWAWQDKRLQLHGYIVDGSILQKPNTLQYRFQVQSNGKIVHAEYTGTVPGGFKSGSEVVLKGRLNQEHGFSVEPGGVMAK